MNLKSKLFGFAAASVFALSMTSGVMAADPLPGGTTTANVNLLERGAGVCSMSVTNTTINFDALSWDGEEWSTSTDRTISGQVTNGRPRQTCDVTAASSGLHHEDGTDHGQIGLTVGTETMDGTDRLVVNDSITDPFSLNVELGGAGEEDDPGAYQGTINFKIATNGQ